MVMVWWTVSYPALNVRAFFFMQISSTAVSPFFVEDIHELQLNSLKLISMVCVYLKAVLFLDHQTMSK